MGKSIQRSSTLRSNLSSRSSLFITVGAFLGSLYLFANANPAITLLFSLCAAVSAGLLTNTIRTRISQPKSNIEASFTFNNAPTVPHRPTSLFEYEVAGLIYKLTGNRTEVVEDESDSGVDIKVYGPGGTLVGVVQCQNLAANKTTHPAFIRDLNMLRKKHDVQTAYLVSKGRFSEESQKLAAQLGIKLIDGSALTRLRKQAVSA